MPAHCAHCTLCTLYTLCTPLSVIAFLSKKPLNGHEKNPACLFHPVHHICILPCCQHCTAMLPTCRHCPALFGNAICLEPTDAPLGASPLSLIFASHMPPQVFPLREDGSCVRIKMQLDCRLDNQQPTKNGLLVGQPP